MDRKIREIPQYPGYFASSDGLIYSLKAKTGELYLLKQRIQRNHWGSKVGYLYVRLPSGWKTVHRLVCSAFHGQPPAHYECRHLNGQKFDNRSKNLSWGTSRQNFSDRIVHGQFKLTPVLVRQIRKELAKGAIRSVLAKRYKVSYHTIYLIDKRKIWRS